MIAFKKLTNCFLLILLAFFSCSCSSQDLSDVKKSCSSLTVPNESDLITNDEIILALLNGPLGWKNIQESLVAVVKSEIPSPHSPSTKNYLVKAGGPEGFYSYFLSGKNSFPLCLNIKSPDILARISNTSSEFDFFIERLENNKQGLLMIDTIEGGNVVQLKFSDGQLVSVMYRSNYLD